MMYVDASDPLHEAMDDIAAAASCQPVPGTLHGVNNVARPDVVVFAYDLRGMTAVLEAGYPQAMALIPANGRDFFGPLHDHVEMLDAVQKFIVAGGPVSFVEELARRLGRDRVWRAIWPAGCLDGADTLQAHGIQAVRDGLEGAEPYPISGINHPSSAAMLAYRHAPAPPVLTTGCGATGAIMRLPGEGKLIIVTGVPNHGKSTWLTHVMAHTAEKHDRRWAVFSPEFGEWQNLAAQIIAWRAAKPFRAVPGAGMTDCEIAEGSDWCGSRFAFLACDGESEAPTLDWLIERARACVLRDGTTDFVIDPWNEIEHDEGGRTETAYVGRALQRLRAFVGRHGCNVWIVAHPTKLKAFKPGEPVPVPTAYDIATSSNWANKADLIVTVHCPDTVTQIHLLKARFRRWGRRGAMAELEFDPTTGRFRSVTVTDAMRDAHCSRNQDD